MAKYQDFVGMVREQRTKSPTMRDFDPSVWTGDRATFPASRADDALHAAGLWFHSALKLRWDRLAALGFGSLEPAFANTLIAIVANANELEINALLDAARNGTGEFPPLVGAASLRLGADPATAATADMRRTSTVDALGKAVGLVGALSSSEEKQFGVEEMAESLRLFQDIYLLEFLWGRVLWLGWTMQTTGTEQRFDPPELNFVGRSMVVADWRHEQLGAEFAMTFALEWVAPRSVLDPCWEVRARSVPGGYAFRARRLSPGQGRLSPAYVSLQLLAAGELGPYLDSPLARESDGAHFSLRDVVEGWELIALAAGDILPRLAVRDGRQSHERLAVPVSLGALVDLLGHLGWSSSKSRAVIDFLTFAGKSLDGVWTKPLLPAGSRRLLLLTPLVYCNLIRVAELWVAEGAGEVVFAERGTAFETRLRERLAAGLAARSWSPGCAVVRDGWAPTIQGAPRDIDLLIRIGSTVFVGEVKLKRHPNSAAEVGRHLREFDKAASQLDLRIPYLRANLGELAKRTGYAGSLEHLRVMGFILSGTAFGSGLAARDYPIVDHEALSFFFDYDFFLTAAKVERESEYRGQAARPELSITLVDDDPAVCLAAYLRDPLHVRHAEAGLVRIDRRNVLLATGESLIWPEQHVDMAALLADGSRRTTDELRAMKDAGQRRARLELTLGRSE